MLLERELPCEVNDIAECLATFPHQVERVGFPPLSGLLSAALLFSNFQVGGIGQ